MDWKEENNQLIKTFVFNDFNEAFHFMKQVAAVAENQNHHPWWSNQWNTVEIKLNTHEAGNTITEKDYLLAKAIDHLMQQ